MKRGILVSGTVVIFMILLSFQVMAQGGKISIGKMKVIPKVSLQGESNDNIYSADTDEESDWITHIKPGIMVDYNIKGRGNVGFGYEIDLAYYSDNSKNNWNTQKALFNLNYEAPGGLNIRINNSFTDAEDPYGSLDQYGVGALTKRWNNDLKSVIGYNFGNSFKILWHYNYYKQDYDDDDQDYTQDYDSSEFGAEIQFRLVSKTWGFIRYHFGAQDYLTHRGLVNESNDADFDWQRINLGLTWDSGAKLSGELNFGAQRKEYENKRDSLGNLYDDKSTWIAATSINYTATSTTTVSLSISRALRQSGSDTNDYFVDTATGISVIRKILTKFTLNAGLTYSTNEYYLPANKSREDDNLIANIGIDYNIRDWLTAGAGYNYNQKDSNYNTNDYVVNKFMLTVSAVY